MAKDKVRLLEIGEVLELDNKLLIQEQLTIQKELYNKMIGSFYKTLVLEKICKIKAHLEYLEDNANSVRFSKF